MQRALLIASGVLLILALLVASFLAGTMFKSKLIATAVPEAGISYALLSEVIGVISHSYVDKVEEEQLTVGAVKGMLRELEDPYTHYLDPSDYEKFVEETEGQFSGVGMEVGMKEESVVVVAPIADTPAFEAGLKAGDIIITVDEKPTKGLALDEVVSEIRGPKGTTVTIGIIREGEDKPLEFKLVRDDIRVPNATWKMLDGDIGYMYLHFFNKTATSGLKDGLEELKGKGAEGIVLDLRNNPGGILDEAIGVTSLFLPKGKEVVEIKGRRDEPKSYNTKGGGDNTIPLVVLVDEGSASASEIVAGALQDHGRAELVGEKTFGKASVQDIINVSNGAAVVITTARYFTPKGTSLYKKGVEPDHVLKTAHGERDPENDKQLDLAIEVLGKQILKSKKAA